MGQQHYELYIQASVDTAVMSRRAQVTSCVRLVNQSYDSANSIGIKINIYYSKVETLEEKEASDGADETNLKILFGFFTMVKILAI